MAAAPDDTGAGNSTHTPLYYQETENLAEELNLSPGDILQSRVVSRLSGQESRILLSLRGRQVVAASDLKVSPGDNLIVRVQSISHPVKLKIFEPHEALKDLSENQLSGILRDMDLEPTTELLEAAGQLLKEDMHLDSELLELTREHWEKLSAGQQEIQPGRFRALRFLYDLDAPVNETLISTLGEFIGRGNSADSWQPALTESNLVSPVKLESFSSLVQGLGVDLIRQLGKRPQTASRTLHARLLKELKNNSTNVSSIHFLLGRLLALALGSLVNDKEYYLAVPFVLAGEIRELQLWIKIGETPADWSIPDWSLSGYFPFDKLGEIRFDLNCSQRRLGCIFAADSSTVIELVRNNISGLVKTLEEGNYNVQLKFQQKKPTPLPDPFSREEETGQKRPGKVDFLA